MCGLAALTFFLFFWGGGGLGRIRLLSFPGLILLYAVAAMTLNAWPGLRGWCRNGLHLLLLYRCCVLLILLFEVVDGAVAQNWGAPLTGCCGGGPRVDLRVWGYFCHVLCEIVRCNVVRGIGTLGPTGNGGGRGKAYMRVVR